MSVRRIEQLPWSSIAHELVGAEHGLPVTILFVDAPPGRGPSLHRHPYAELFIVQEGEVTFTLGDAYDPHPTANQEIDGVMFPDMPWMIGNDAQTAEVRATVAQAFGESGARRGRLFAFGYDAMRIASALQRGAPLNPQGLTGKLSLDPEGRVRRELEWVRIKGGVPAPLEPAAQ